MTSVSRWKVTYRYDRCANGRRVHNRRGEPQVHAREDEILDQFASVRDAVEIATDFADDIAAGFGR
jgi:hypothetical protein